MLKREGKLSVKDDVVFPEKKRKKKKQHLCFRFAEEVEAGS